MDTSTERPVYNAEADIAEQYARVSRLLRGAVQIIVELGGMMGPDLSEWYRQQQLADDKAAERVLLSIPDEDIRTLNDYIARHGMLPAGLVVDAIRD